MKAINGIKVLTTMMFLCDSSTVSSLNFSRYSVDRIR